MTTRFPVYLSIFALVFAGILFALPFTAHAAPPRCTLTAQPSHVDPGEGFSLTLSSTSTNVTSGTISQGVGTVTIDTPKQISGISQKTTYVGTVSNSEGAGSCVVEVTVEVDSPTCTLTASPSQVVPGQGFSLTLQSTSPGVTSGTVDKGIGTLTVGVPRQSISLAEGGTYTATVSNSGGTGTCSAEVRVQALDGSGGGGGGGGGSNPAQMLQGLGQLLGGLGQLQGALGGNNAQNAACNPVYPECPCRMKPHGCPRGQKCCPGANMFMCEVGSCQNSTNGFTSLGQCTAPNFCTGRTSGGGQGPLGGGQQGLAGGLGALGQIMQGLGSLLGGGGGSGGGSSAGSAGFGAYPTYAGCVQTYITSTITSDPCAIYQPGTSGQLTGTTGTGLASDLLGALGESQTPVSQSITNTNVDPSQTSTGQQDLGATTTLEGGLTGDVRLNPGATIFANLREGITEIAGFFGGNTFGGEGTQSTLSRLCGSRPWAGSGFLASLAPDGFFDGLCRAAGYQVGQVQQTGGGAQRAQTFTTEQAPPVETSTGPFLEPRVDIRAEPPSVRLGTRTYIFWTSEGIVPSSCAVRGPSFEQYTPAGAGATVPITGPTTYTIECTAERNSDEKVRDSVTVNLAI